MGMYDIRNRAQQDRDAYAMGGNNAAADTQGAGSARGLMSANGGPANPGAGGIMMPPEYYGGEWSGTPSRQRMGNQGDLVKQAKRAMADSGMAGQDYGGINQGYMEPPAIMGSGSFGGHSGEVFNAPSFGGRQSLEAGMNADYFQGQGYYGQPQMMQPQQQMPQIQQPVAQPQAWGDGSRFRGLANQNVTPQQYVRLGVAPANPVRSWAESALRERDAGFQAPSQDWQAQGLPIDPNAMAAMNQQGYDVAPLYDKEGGLTGQGRAMRSALDYGERAGMNPDVLPQQAALAAGLTPKEDKNKAEADRENRKAMLDLYLDGKESENGAAHVIGTLEKNGFDTSGFYIKDEEGKSTGKIDPSIAGPMFFGFKADIANGKSFEDAISDGRGLSKKPMTDKEKLKAADAAQTAEKQAADLAGGEQAAVQFAGLKQRRAAERLREPKGTIAPGNLGDNRLVNKQEVATVDPYAGMTQEQVAALGQNSGGRVALNPNSKTRVQGAQYIPSMESPAAAQRRLGAVQSHPEYYANERYARNEVFSPLEARILPSDTKTYAPKEKQSVEAFQDNIRRKWAIEARNHIEQNPNDPKSLELMDALKRKGINPWGGGEMMGSKEARLLRDSVQFGKNTEERNARYVAPLPKIVPDSPVAPPSTHVFRNKNGNPVFVPYPDRPELYPGLTLDSTRRQ